MTPLLDAAQTAARLPWTQLVEAIASLLRDPSVQVAPRLVQALPGGGSLFVMPALDSRVAITKLITFTPGNAGGSLPAIQGDVLVFDVASGQRQLILDGPTVTARRTAAVSALAARLLAPVPQGPLLLIGAGVQAKAHLQAFAEVLGTQEVMIASRRIDSSEALALHARSLGLSARVVGDANAALADCALAVTCTPASQVVLHALPPSGIFVAAVGAFTPSMAELAPVLCRHFHDHGSIFVDTGDAAHEAGDLLQAGLDPARCETLADVVISPARARQGPVLFKSCGWAGWDLAAARTALSISA